MNAERLQEAAVLERLGAVRQRQHPVAGRQRVLGQLERPLHHLPLVDPPQHPRQQQLDRHRGRGRAAAAQRRPGGAVSPINIGWIALRGQQPALPQRRPDHRLGRPGRRRRPATPACRRATPSTSTAPGAATVNQLVPFTYNPATGAVTTVGDGHLQHRGHRSCRRPTQVVQTDARMVDMLAKAGVDLTANRRPTWPPGATVTASLHRLGHQHRRRRRRLPDQRAVLGRGRLAQRPGLVRGELRHRPDASTRCGSTSRTAGRRAATYRAPSSYNIQYLNGSTWTTVASQVKTPAAPRGNYNQVHVHRRSRAQRVRVLATNASGAKTGLTEIKVYNRGGVQPTRSRPEPGQPGPVGDGRRARSPRRGRAARPSTTAIEPTSSNYTAPTGQPLGHLAQPGPAVGRAAPGRRRRRSTGRRSTSSTTTRASTCRRRGSCSTGTAAPTSTSPGASGYPRGGQPVQHGHLHRGRAPPGCGCVLQQHRHASVGLLEVKAFAS